MQLNNFTVFITITSYLFLFLFSSFCQTGICIFGELLDYSTLPYAEIWDKQNILVVNVITQALHSFNNIAIIIHIKDKWSV